MLGCALKFVVTREHQQAMAHAWLRQERVDGAYLSPMASARIAKQGCLNVIGSGERRGSAENRSRIWP